MKDKESKMHRRQSARDLITPATFQEGAQPPAAPEPRSLRDMVPGRKQASREVRDIRDLLKGD